MSIISFDLFKSTKTIPFALIIFSIFGVSLFPPTPSSLSQNINTEASVLGASFVLGNEFDVKLSSIEVTPNEPQNLLLVANKEIKQVDSAQIKLERVNLKLPDLHTYKFEFDIDSNEPQAVKINFLSVEGDRTQLDVFLNLRNLDLSGKVTEKCLNYSEIDPLEIVLDRVRCVTITGVEQDLRTFQWNGKQYLVSRYAMPSLERMLTDAQKDGINLQIVSSFRNLAFQSSIFNNPAINTTGYIAARPGFSEHHLGTAFDMAAGEYSGGYKIPFGRSKGYQWMLKNGYKYGFVLSYPQGKSSITGYPYEPWHWRYIGEENAWNLEALEDTTLREYLYLLETNNT